MSTSLLLISILTQYAAAIIALRHVRSAGHRIAWGSIAIALFLMGVRRTITLFTIVYSGRLVLTDLWAEVVALFISVLMLFGVIMVGRMLSDVKLNEHRLAESKARLSTAAEMANLGFYVWDSVADKCKYCSNEYAAMHGVTPEEYIATASRLDGSFSHTHPEDREAYRAACIGLKNGKGFEIKYRIITPQGVIRWLHEIAKPVFGNDGTVIEDQIVAQDVTDQHQAEMLLRDNAAAFEHAERIALIHNWTSDPSFQKWVASSNSAKHVLGVPMGDLLGENSNFLSYVHPADRKFVEEAYKNIRYEAKPYSLEYRFCRPDGKVVYLREAGEPVFDDKGQISHYQRIAQDITVVKQTQTQLVQSSKLASLGEMATGIAHELNQPLNVIRMSVEILDEMAADGDVTPADVIQKTSRISEQVDRASVIINHMRSFGREAPEEKTPISVIEAVSSATLLAQEQCRGESVEINIDVPETRCPPVLGNAIRLEQVVVNLLSNARQAIATSKGVNGGSGRIDLKVTNYPETDSVQIIVSDNGGGIPEDIIDNIFDPFFTTKELGIGTGVGLSVSYGIIAEMDGSIMAENVDGGAAFTIILPCTNREAEHA